MLIHNSVTQSILVVGDYIAHSRVHFKFHYLCNLTISNCMSHAPFFLVAPLHKYAYRTLRIHIAFVLCWFIFYRTADDGTQCTISFRFVYIRSHFSSNYQQCWLANWPSQYARLLGAVSIGQPPSNITWNCIFTSPTPSPYYRSCMHDNRLKCILHHGGVIINFA